MRKRCKRKVWALVNPIEYAINGARVTDEQSLDKLRLKELTALDAMKRGKGTPEDWTALVDMNNICEMFIKRGYGKEALKDCTIAHQSLKDAAIRYSQTGKMGLDGAGMNALAHVFEWHDAMRTSVSRSVYESIIDDVRNHIISQAKEVTRL